MPRVRSAAAPTGLVYIGGAQTFLFDARYTGSTSGRMLLRIDGVGVGSGAFHLFTFTGRE